MRFSQSFSLDDISFLCPKNQIKICDVLMDDELCLSFYRSCVISYMNYDMI